MGGPQHCPFWLDADAVGVIRRGTESGQLSGTEPDYRAADHGAELMICYIDQPFWYQSVNADSAAGSAADRA